MEPICGIYKIENNVNHKVYIGQSTNVYKRWKDHVYALRRDNHPNEHLQKSWNKYGEQAFVFSVEMLCPEKDLNQNEIDAIQKYKSNEQQHGYNMTAGGDGSHGLLDEILQRRNERIKQVYIEHPEMREAARQKTLAQFENEEFYREYINLRRSEEFREKERQTHLNKKMPEEVKEKIRQTIGKPVRCVETGIVYRSAKEASRQMPGNLNIQAVALGKRKSAGGYHWEYV